MKLQELAAWLHGEVVGDSSLRIRGLAKIEAAAPGDLTFLSNPKYEPHLKTTRASAVLVSRKLELSAYARRKGIAFVRVEDPYGAFARLIERFHPEPDPLPSGVHPTAVVAKSATLGKRVSLGAHAVIGERARLGDGTVVSHGSVVGDDCELGAGCRIYPNVTIYHRSRLGDRVTIHSGTIVGSDGFGFYRESDGSYHKIPQVGIVVIEDDVEIGANCAIDRATMGETRIARGAKLDNLIQVGHNNVIGENTVVAGQTGIAGSTRIGASCMIGGQVGIAGHITIADRTTLLAKTGVTRAIPEPGKMLMGYPAKEQHEFQRIEAVTRKLPELLRRLRALERKAGSPTRDD